uniref:Putative ovule protein n=1 Tax=Solanum chacoense TaxID=4108 RepID=A0A0V0GLQ1_SOLCH
MHSPRPVPPCKRVVEGSACSKLSNTDSHLLGSIPQPESSTSNHRIILLSFLENLLPWLCCRFNFTLGADQESF